jgi:hypothetical protein
MRVCTAAYTATSCISSADLDAFAAVRARAVMTPVCTALFGLQLHCQSQPDWRTVAWGNTLQAAPKFGASCPSASQKTIDRRTSMRIAILLQITDDAGVAAEPEVVIAFDKPAERPEDLGLSIADGKALLVAVQERMVPPTTELPGMRSIAPEQGSLPSCLSHAGRRSCPTRRRPRCWLTCF